VNKYRMVCLDIDGTLLNSKHQITEETKAVIEKIAREKDISVVLVSARMPKGILFLQEQLNIVEPIICYSGALIISKSSEILLTKTISVNHIKKIYALAKEHDIHMSLYKDNEWYVEKMDEWTLQESRITNVIPIEIEFNELLDLWEEMNCGANKILCMGNSELIQSLNKEVKLNKLDDINAHPSKPTYLEVMPGEASKTSAIDYLRRKLGVEQSEILAIGDNYNDIDMIEYAGLGIAMGNAPEEVKKYADSVTYSNDENGVARALEKYIDNK
jgi:Cof subfamily protein (haloacid dehalogenase superfamily)